MGPEGARVDRAARLAVRHEDAPPAVPDAVAAEAARHFAALRAANPHLFDGNVLLFRDVSVAGGTFRATAVPASYALMLAILDGRARGLGLFNVFGAVAPFSADGALLLGEMGARTYEPGAVKLAAGTPEAGDVDRAAGTVDLDASMARELAEETGLEAAAARPAPDCLVVRDGPYCAVVRPMVFPEAGEALKARAAAFLAAEREPELAALALARGPDDPVLDRAPAIQRTIVRALFRAGPFPSGPGSEAEGDQR